MAEGERQLEEHSTAMLRELKYAYRADSRDRGDVEQNFRRKFEELTRARLTDGKFQRRLEEISTHDVFAAARTLRGGYASSVCDPRSLGRRFAAPWRDMTLRWIS